MSFGRCQKQRFSCIYAGFRHLIVLIFSFTNIPFFVPLSKVNGFNKNHLFHFCSNF
uniref:Uncharacterized protein n=1 Tax=Siphoviridae sp. ctX926 TaxID=2826366 RepID=A0A8S5M1N6_9CAUD|nr:MAG TPA: hypothetical protein [Siphoviridae sp. ctX926]